MTQHITLELQALTKTGFAEFGDVIECEGSESFLINDGNARRFNELAIAQTDDEVGISIFLAEPIKDIVIKMMERHPLGSQAFMPLQNCPWIVVVAADDNGKPSDPQAFIASGKQGVNYYKNVWHHPLLVIGDVGEFLVVDRKGDGENLQEVNYPVTYKINEPC